MLSALLRSHSRLSLPIVSLFMSRSSHLSTYIGSIDQGTSSTRFILFDAAGNVIDKHQVALSQYHIPGQAGWHEHDPNEMYEAAQLCIDTVMERHTEKTVRCIGITNQRETTVVWDKHTGQPLHRAIVWHDNRAADICSSLINKHGSIDYWRGRTGLPISTYFSAFKLHWILHVAHTLPEEQRPSLSPSLSSAVSSHSALFGTVDSWLIWRLTGGNKGGIHVTDVTNASRTMLMDIHTCEWAEDIAHALRIPLHMLPIIKSSSEIYGHVTEGALAGVPVSGCLGDQQAALVGQLCFKPGDAKNTYGTGCFMLVNTGHAAIVSHHGLISTVAYQFGPRGNPSYALEGSISVAGAAVRWMKDEMRMIKDAQEISR